MCYRFQALSPFYTQVGNLKILAMDDIIYDDSVWTPEGDANVCIPGEEFNDPDSPQLTGVATQSYVNSVTVKPESPVTDKKRSPIWKELLALDKSETKDGTES